MDFEWLNYIIVQYQVLGVALAVILPFIIFFFFIHSLSHSSAFRRTAWIFYMVIYYGIWTTSPNTGMVSDAYAWSLIIAIGMFMFDPIIHKLMTKDANLAPLRASINNSIADLDQELDRINHAAHISPSEKAKMKKFLEKQILKYQKGLGKL
jgi:hypothetical protein